MFLNNFLRISKRKRCFNVKSSTYYFYMKTKLLVELQIFISVSLKERLARNDFVFSHV